MDDTRYDLPAVKRVDELRTVPMPDLRSADARTLDAAARDLRTVGERVDDELGALRADNGLQIRPPRESFAMALLSAVEPVLPQRYRVVPAEQVATVLLRSALLALPGIQIIESAAILHDD